MLKHDLIIAAMCLWSLCACGETWAERNVRLRAADTFRCDSDNVKVKEWGPNAYKAEGCKKTKIFTCVQGGGASDTPTCTAEK